MNLHNEKELFGQYIAATADYMGLGDAGIVEKDYFVTCFLQKIAEKLPGMIFKGGTSLSKCHKIIRRFSEDIDLSVDTEAARLTEGQRKRLKQDIISIIEESGFRLENPGQIRSRRDFNQYVVDYQGSPAYGSQKRYLIVETSVFIKSFPAETMEASSFVYDFLAAKGIDGEIEKYGLEPFKVRVQSIERTFIDKVFAIADYCIDGNIDNHSRHIYDLYKIYPSIDFNEGFSRLVTEVREIRKPHAACRSAQDGVDLRGVLQKIIEDDIFRLDYKRFTETLLFEDMPYTKAIAVLARILDRGCFA